MEILLTFISIMLFTVVGYYWDQDREDKKQIIITSLKFALIGLGISILVIALR